MFVGNEWQPEAWILVIACRCVPASARAEVIIWVFARTPKFFIRYPYDIAKEVMAGVAQVVAKVTVRFSGPIPIGGDGFIHVPEPPERVPFIA